MPDWGKVLKDIGASLAAASREASAKQQAALRREKTFGRVYELNRCLFWNCNTPIRPDHIFCYDHFQDLQDGIIDECPGCGRAKDVQYEVCLDCYHDSRSRPSRKTSAPRNITYHWYKPEYSAAWKQGDATADRFFVYILRLDGGQFYAGQTRELRERLSEHRDGRVQSTARKNPKLVWFTTVDTREAAAGMEVELKKLADSNPREIRRMMLGFQVLVQELDFS